jgi:crotonobetainyl-CoA:carnitine CoA-transferase CaiB-like acyl-CoA transferase
MPAFGPLAGVRVLDMTVALAGPFATMLLADLGAAVIKVESLQHYSQPSRGPRVPPSDDDPASFSFRRDYADGDPGDDPWNRISWFNSHARNKRDVTMDITRPEGRDLFLRLVELSDGFVENNAPGLLERFNIGPDVLLARNPRLVIVRMPPLGLSGPDVKATGFGWHFEELSGLLSMQGYADGETVGSIFMDGASGPARANAFLMGLLAAPHRPGAVVEVAQVENLTVHIGDLVMDAAMHDRVPPRWGNRSPDFAPQGVYRCAGDDQWLVLSVRDDGEWASLRAVLGDPRRWPARAGHPAGRRAAHDEIDASSRRGQRPGPRTTPSTGCRRRAYQPGRSWTRPTPSPTPTWPSGASSPRSGTRRPAPTATRGPTSASDARRRCCGGRRR